jgi:hypothetical protein
MCFILNSWQAGDSIWLTIFRVSNNSIEFYRLSGAGYAEWMLAGWSRTIMMEMAAPLNAQEAY